MGKANQMPSISTGGMLRQRLADVENQRELEPMRRANSSDFPARIGAVDERSARLTLGQVPMNLCSR